MTDLWKAKRETVKNKIWKPFRLFILRRDGFRCVQCGRGKDDGVILQGGHLFSGHHDSTMFDEDAVHCQCKRCNHDHNDNPWPYWNWYIQKFGRDPFHELKRKHHNNAVLTRADLVELYEHYKNLDKEYLLLDRLAGVKPKMRENNDGKSTDRNRK